MTLAKAIAMVPEKYRTQVSWGDRGGGQPWQARVGPYSTIGNGGPYRTAEQAIFAAIQLAKAEGR